MRHLVLAALALSIASAAVAQSPSPANCRVWQPHVDNPIDYTHYYTQPALAWDIENAVASAVAAKIIEKATPLSPMQSALIPSIGLGLGLHVLGHAQGRYPISLHWAFTLFDRSLPIALASDNRAKAVTAWLVATVATECYDR